MWRASLIAYEKFKSRYTDDKFYRAVLSNAETRQQRPSRVMHKTASDALAYAQKFNDYFQREHQIAKPRKFLPDPNLWQRFLGLLTDYAQGIDLSHYDGYFDPQLATQTIDFVIQKLTEGTTYVDSLVEELWTGVQQIPVRLAYHYFRSGMDWKAQADFFLGIAARHSYHAFAIDVESYGNTYSDAFFAGIRRFVDYVQVQTGRRVVVYTNGSTYTQMSASIAKQFVDGQAWMEAMEFWYAWPSTNANPSLPRGRTTWTMWQNSWSGSGYGTGTAVDTNVFNGSVKDLHAWAGVPTEESPMIEVKVVGPYGLNLRPAPSTGNDPILLSATGTLIWGEKRPDGWIHGMFYQQPGETYATALDFYCSGGSFYVQDVTYNDPVLPPPDKKVTLNELRFSIDEDVYLIENVEAVKQ